MGQRTHDPNPAELLVRTDRRGQLKLGRRLMATTGICGIVTAPAMPCNDDPVTALFLFDLDGTMVDHRGAVLAAIRQIVQGAASARLPADELVELWWDLERTHMRHYLDGECSFTEQRHRLHAFLPLLGEPVPGDAGLDAWFAERYLPNYEGAWSCYPDVFPCLEALAGLPGPPRRAVLTNGDPQQQRAKLARFGLLGHFEAVLTSADLGVAKPDPAAFTAACRWLDVNPRDVISVADWLEGDVIAATRAGLTAVWLDRGVDPVTGKPPDQAKAPDPAPARIEHLTDLTAAYISRRPST
jgi:HAD superfamily hydrolase (TIGR01549 family)